MQAHREIGNPNFSFAQ